MSTADLEGAVDRLGDEVGKIRDRLMDSELSQNKEIGEIKAAVRVVKHSQSNQQQMIGIVSDRLDKMETHFSTAIKEVKDSVTADVKVMSDKLSSELKNMAVDISKVTIQQNRGAGFFAGIGASIGIVAAFLMFMGKILFGGGLSGH